MKNTAEVVRVKGAFAWVEGQQVIKLKAVANDGKAPTDLTSEDARTLAKQLTKLAGILDSLQAEE